MGETEIIGTVGAFVAIVGIVFGWVKWRNGHHDPEAKATFVRFHPDDQTRLTIIGNALLTMREDNRIRNAADDVWKADHQETTREINTGITELAKEFAEMTGYLRGINR